MVIIRNHFGLKIILFLQIFLAVIDEKSQLINDSKEMRKLKIYLSDTKKTLLTPTDSQRDIELVVFIHQNGWLMAYFFLPSYF